MISIRSLAAVAVGALIAAPGMALADTYTQATYSGAINPGGANVKAPFSGAGFTQGDALGGSFVFDDQLVGGAGFTNVYYNSFPDVALIPLGDLFNFTLDSLHFTAADNIDALNLAGVQYKNGQFNGFQFITDFAFGASFYQLRIDGSAITVKLLDGVANAFDPHGFTKGGSLINAHINIGNGNLTNQSPYTPVVVTPGVPEPATWALMIMGFGAVGVAVRRQRTAKAVAA